MKNPKNVILLTSAQNVTQDSLQCLNVNMKNSLYHHFQLTCTKCNWNEIIETSTPLDNNNNKKKTI